MSNDSKQNKANSNLLFSSYNYKILGVGILLVIIGFTAMYLENEVEGFISLFISPILIVAGYITVLFSIILHAKPKAAETTEE